MAHTSINRNVGTWVLWIITCVIVATSLLPLIWIFLGSLKTPAELWAYPPTFLPANPSIKNFKVLFSGEESRLPFLINSLITALTSTLLTLILAVPAGYGFARMNVRGSKNLEFWILSTRMMPQVAALIPIFMIIRKVGLFDTHAALIVVYTMFNVSYAVWMLTIFFRKVPYEIEEAALIDGCNIHQSLLKVVLPIMLPSILTVGIFIFGFSWNELMFALVLTGNRAKTLPVALSEYTSGNFYRWELLTAATVIQIIPALLIIIFLQRFIVSGMTMGAVKQ